MDVLIQIVAFLITILVLVSIHEAGHFLVAKLFGIKVVRFSIGFGKPFVRYKDRSGTEYVIAWLPLGGYVSLLDEREMKVPEDQKKFAFNRQPLAVRAAVVIAGPLTNFLFAVLCFWIMFMIGVEAMKPIIGKVAPQSIAAEAGLKDYDQILSVDGKKTPDWQKVVIHVVERLGEKNTMVLTTENTQTHKQHRYVLKLKDWKINPLNPDLLNSLGIQAYRPPLPAILEEVAPSSPAEKSGLKKGDKILFMDDKPVQDWYDFVTYIHNHPNQKVKIKFQQGQKVFTTEVQVTHQRVGLKNYGFIGVKPPKVTIPKNMRVLHQYNAIVALGQGFKETWQFLLFNFTIIKKMILGQISLGNLGGPISLFQTAEIAFLQGIAIFLGFLGLISVMLGFINILPIPGLDGGHLLYYLIELIRGKPLSPAMEVLTIRIGIIILLLIMFIGTFNDILRIFTKP